MSESLAEKIRKKSRKQDKGYNRNDLEHKERRTRYTGGGERFKREGSYSSGKKPFSNKTRTQEGTTKTSEITGVEVRGKQIKNKRRRR